MNEKEMITGIDVPVTLKYRYTAGSSTEKFLRHLNDGRIVASDSPDNLTKRLKGSESLFLEVEGPRKEIESKIKTMKGITKVTTQRKTRQDVVGCQVETELNTDLRKDLAALIVQQGWGLMELRPMGMSLEDIYLHLTTKEEEVSGE